MPSENNKQPADIAIVIPLYNEEKVFPLLVGRLEQTAAAVPLAVEFVFVDDGSGDATPQLVRDYCLTHTSSSAVFLSRNFGHQIAVSAGMAATHDSKAVMIIDGDLQDPPELCGEFYEKIKLGYEVVYAVRKKRKENRLKKAAYWLFYRLLNSISSISIPLDSGDFCMISRRVCDRINAMPERSRFLRGIRTWVGFKQIGIEYERDKRMAGEEKYTFKKLCMLAYDGIFNFSDVPLRIITKLGLAVIILSVVYIAFVFIVKMLGIYTPQGFLSIVVAISLFSGVQLISLGIIGEYLSRIYEQVKNRPLYIVREKIEHGRVLGDGG